MHRDQFRKLVHSFSIIVQSFLLNFNTLTIVVVIKFLFTVNLPSNVNIFAKFVTEIQGLLPCQLWNRQEGVDLLCSLQAPHLLQWDVNLGDELRREVPGGGLVDEVPLLGVDLGTAGLLSQLSLRHRPGQYKNIIKS